MRKGRSLSPALSRVNYFLTFVIHHPSSGRSEAEMMHPPM